MKIGLFFGSFNPIHIGHLVIANYTQAYSDLDKIWFVVSPQNPFKKKDLLLEDYHRIELVSRAVKGYSEFEVSAVELSLPKPSYTIDTLTYLNQKYPSYEFTIIMGSDNLEYLHKWKSFEKLLRDYQFIVYPRPTYDANDFKYNGKIKIVCAPLMEISSTLIRKMIRENKKPYFFVPLSVYEYIEQQGFYEK